MGGMMKFRFGLEKFAAAVVVSGIESRKGVWRLKQWWKERFNRVKGWTFDEVLVRQFDSVTFWTIKELKIWYKDLEIWL